ncbi:MAG: peptidyl-prolyl cis-trans isomerase [Tannerella sp.]|nr:peptidyl-prolyl cis-trans isomerase [Tannerella sp.]
MRNIVFFILAVVFFNACRPSVDTEGSNALVTVHGYTLTRGEVEKIVPKNISSSDSLLIAESYVKKWVKDILTYEVAERNIGKDESEINHLVEEYRRSLLRYRYQNHMVRSRLSADIRENDKISFYHENMQRFTLDKNLIKGLFLKVPVDAPGLNDVRKWYKSDSPESLESIEKYSIQNASMYDYFYDRWVDFDEIIDKIPVQITNKTQFLKSNRSIEKTDSIYCYFLNISEYILSGNITPYEYAEPQIHEMIINKRKVDFLKEFEEGLYRDAVRNGYVVFHTNQK